MLRQPLGRSLLPTPAVCSQSLLSWPSSGSYACLLGTPLGFFPTASIVFYFGRESQSPLLWDNSNYLVLEEQYLRGKRENVQCTSCLAKGQATFQTSSHLDWSTELLWPCASLWQACSQYLLVPSCQAVSGAAFGAYTGDSQDSHLYLK